MMDFSVTEEGGIAFEPAGTAKYSASKWIKLGKSDVKLAPGKGENVECTIKAPYSAAGEYYSAVMVNLGLNGLPVRVAGQFSEQRPHSVQA